MTLVIEDKRRYDKRSTVPGQKPTVPASNDHTDGSWIATDIYVGELFINMADGLVYTRSHNDEIIEVNQADGIVSGMDIVPGSDSVTFSVSAGVVRLAHKLISHGATADEFTVSDGDVTNPRIDLIYIDDTNVVQVEEGTPAASPAPPAQPADTILLGYVLVPANHVAASNVIQPFTVDRWNDRFNLTVDWATELPFVAGMLVIESNKLYQCTAPHGSDVFATDLATYWQLIGEGINVIGAAEDGDYTDGLFTDFTPTTPIGTPVDRFNEILKYLVPPPAPSLSDWDGDKSVKEPGKLSFDTANPIGGYNAADAVGIPIPVSVDGLFDVSGKRLGVSPAVGGGDISGTLNPQVPAHPSVPTPAYVADSFGDAEKGSLNLYINGVLVATVDLTSTTAAIDGTSGGTVTGMSVSAQSASKFPQGDDFDQFQNRTGTWLVKAASLANGYNSVVVEHDTGATIYTLDRHEVVIDADTTATAYSSEVLDSPLMTGSKMLSGVDYHTGGTADYDITIDNAYRNTYSPDADAIAHTGVKCSAVSAALGANAGNEALTVTITNKVVTITPAGIRLINEAISLTTTVKRTVQAELTSAGASQPNLLVDNVAASSTVLVEDFNDETYRMSSDTDFEDYASFTTGMWDSGNSIKESDAIAGHDDGMQTIEGSLRYPNYDFTTANIPEGSTYNDGGTQGTARDYSGETNTRTYYRWFKQVSPAVSNFTIKVDGDASINFVGLATALNSSRAHLEIKGPSQTGWMDGYKDFATGMTSDGDGARSAAAGAGGINSVLGLTIGTKSTANTGGYIVVKITVDDSFAYDFDKITFTFG